MSANPDQGFRRGYAWGTMTYTGAVFGAIIWVLILWIWVSLATAVLINAVMLALNWTSIYYLKRKDPK